MKMPSKNILLILVALLIVGMTWLFSMQYLSFENVQRTARQIRTLASSHMVITFVSLLLIQAVGMFFTLPTKAIFNMVGCALLGFVPGATLTMAGTLLGTSGLFFTTQRLVQPSILEKLPEFLKRFEAKLKSRPALTVAGLRMILALPYGAITIFCAVTRIPFRAFLIGSFIGDIPVILLYSAAGMKLMALAEKNEAVSAQTVALLSVAGIGIFAGSLLPKKH